MSESRQPGCGRDFPAASAPDPAPSDLRRQRSSSRRVHTLGPLRLNAEEITAIRSAAERAGRLAPGAWAASVLVAVARQELAIVPVDDRARMLELVRARADLVRLVELLGPQDPSRELRQQAIRAVGRLEAAAEAISAAQPRRRLRSPT